MKKTTDKDSPIQKDNLDSTHNIIDFDALNNIESQLLPPTDDGDNTKPAKESQSDCRYTDEITLSYSSPPITKQDNMKLKDLAKMKNDINDIRKLEDTAPFDCDEMCRTEPISKTEIKKMVELSYLQPDQYKKNGVLRQNLNILKDSLFKARNFTQKTMLFNRNNMKSSYCYSNVSNFVYTTIFQKKFLFELFGFIFEKRSSLFSKILHTFKNTREYCFNHELFGIIDELNKRQPDMAAFIFKIRDKKYKEALYQLSIDQGVTCRSKYTSNDLINIVLVYCKKYLRGLVQIVFYKYYEHFYIKNDRERVELMLKYISIIIQPERLKLMRLLLNLFDNNKDVNICFIYDELPTILISPKVIINSRDAYSSLIEIIKHEKYENIKL